MRMQKSLLFALLVPLTLVGGAESPAVGWEKPKTTRRYLQGPFAERLLVFWREGKVTFGEVEHEHDWQKTFYHTPETTSRAHGAWLLHGADDRPFDFRSAALAVESDATPIHAQTWREGDLKVVLEGCAPFGRKPSAHLRLTVENVGRKSAAEAFAFLLRTGEERQLVFGAPDIYAIYAPQLKPWLDLPCVWREKGDGVWTDGDRFVAFRSDLPLAWDADKGAVRLTASLAPGEARTVDLTLGRGEVERPDYDAVRAKTRVDWQRELARVKGRSALIRHLTVQTLQCFSMPANGKDYVLPRQGGLQRWVWPWDQSYASAALTRLGYGEYVERACDFYFDEYATPEGMIGPFGNGWVNDTANVLYVFARYCLDTDNAGYWLRRRAAALAAFRWIKAERARTRDLPGQIAGLFPAGKASDNPKVFQAWGTTDLLNLRGLEKCAEAAERFGDEAAKDIRAEADDYRAAISRVLDRWRAASAGKDTLLIPYRPDGKFEKDLRAGAYFYNHPGRFAVAGFLNEDELMRLRRYLLQEGLANEKGLYFHHPSRTNATLGEHVWYTTAAEYNWFCAWKRVGRDDLARQALDACLRYAVTDEYQVGERYHDANPWYYPWSPNASGAGRILLMLSAGAGDGRQTDGR